MTVHDIPADQMTLAVGTRVRTIPHNREGVVVREVQVTIENAAEAAAMGRQAGVPFNNIVIRVINIRGPRKGEISKTEFCFEAHELEVMK